MIDISSREFYISACTQEYPKILLSLYLRINSSGRGLLMIDECRSQIDVIDSQLLVLLNQRAKLAARLGTLKAAAGMPLRDKDRERQVLARALRANPGPLDGRAITKLFVCIISESRRAQESHNS